jgi:hypothetical protein
MSFEAPSGRGGNMETRELEEIRQSLHKLEARNRHLALGLVAVATVLILGMAALVVHRIGARKSGPRDGILTVRGLIVVDGNGVERVRIAAPLPDPLVLGKRFPRGEAISGILLFDEEGNERSGYVTSDGYPNVFFTLDSLARQHVLFITEPQGDPTLRLWDGASVFSLSVGVEGPQLKLASGDKTLLEVPAQRSAAK